MSTGCTFRLLAWEWDVDRLEQLVDQATTMTLPVGEWADPYLDSDPTNEGPRRRVGLIYTDWDQVDQLPLAALRTPGFVVTLPTDPESLLLVDGWHRLALARRHHVPTIPAYVFGRGVSARALTPRSQPYARLATPTPAQRAPQTQAAS